MPRWPWREVVAMLVTFALVAVSLLGLVAVIVAVVFTVWSVVS